MSRRRSLPRVLSANEQQTLLAQFDTRYPSGLRNLLLVRLMLECGLRSGEVVALRPEHLDLSTGRLLVREGKGAKDRVVWFSEDLGSVLARWLSGRPGSRWLFPTRSGKQIDTRYLREMVKRKAAKADIPDASGVTPHALRHSFATDLFRDTRNIRLTQKALGHANLATTMLYTHLVDEELERAMRKGRSPGSLCPPARQPTPVVPNVPAI